MTGGEDGKINLWPIIPVPREVEDGADIDQDEDSDGAMDIDVSSPKPRKRELDRDSERVSHFKDTITFSRVLTLNPRTERRPGGENHDALADIDLLSSGAHDSCRYWMVLYDIALSVHCHGLIIMDPYPLVN